MTTSYKLLKERNKRQVDTIRGLVAGESMLSQAYMKLAEKEYRGFLGRLKWVLTGR